MMPCPSLSKPWARDRDTMNAQTSDMSKAFMIFVSNSRGGGGEGVWYNGHGVWVTCSTQNKLTIANFNVGAYTRQCSK